MLWMETYLFYCSVRLGVIIVGIIDIINMMIPSIALFTLGLSVLNPFFEIFKNDEEYKNSILVVQMMHRMEHYPQAFSACIQTILFIYIASAISAIYGALKIEKYFILPLCFCEFIRAIFALTFHILMMIVLKKILSLGYLLCLTLGGGFIILFFAYNWASCVAFYQIINLIHSDRYKILYGEDPLNPISSNHDEAIQNVRIFGTPKDSDIDFQKRKNNKLPTIINVLPVSNNYDKHYNGIKNRGRTQEVTPIKNAENIYNDPTEAYDYWQWSELVPKRNKIFY